MRRIFLPYAGYHMPFIFGIIGDIKYDDAEI